MSVQRIKDDFKKALERAQGYDMPAEDYAEALEEVAEDLLVEAKAARS